MIRRWLVVCAVAVAAGVGACGEQLDGGTACPSLCPSQNVTVHDTIISPILVFDSTFVGFPELGQEVGMLLATRGDTLETRGVVRFDTLTNTFKPLTDTTQAIKKVDSSRVRIILDRARATLPASVRFEVYDVDDSVAADTLHSAVLAKFTRGNRIGTLTVLRDSLKDTLFIPLSDSAVLSKLTAAKRLRLGFRVDGSGPVSVRMNTIESGGAALVSYHPATTDTSVHNILASPLSLTPTGTQFPELQSDLLDYTLVAKNTVGATTNTMSVGGMPGRRAYLRFNIPRFITDSATVIKASLRLTQRPVPFGAKTDSMTVHAHVGLAGVSVTDLRRASNIISSPGLLVLDSLIVSPRDSGVRTFELYNLLRAWGTQASVANAPPRAIILRASPEAVLPFEARFFSTGAAANLRPSMLISYIRGTKFGVP